MEYGFNDRSCKARIGDALNRLKEPRDKKQDSKQKTQVLCLTQRIRINDEYRTTKITDERPQP